ncbi:hypothetical protein QYE76_016564 [Lolium multiflorum]|uniref:AP2/ERF domain-containing protein n=1 Tax=Lolium multiflorum TaxID=4521 RepID=A0AAD8QLC5_LOLMU|nr:hypothetical protein QYE76_016564 [Lolium multiflorum]
MAPRRRSNMGFIGVRPRAAGHFASEISAGGVRVWLGTFYTKEAAAAHTTLRLGDQVYPRRDPPVAPPRHRRTDANFEAAYAATYEKYLTVVAEWDLKRAAWEEYEDATSRALRTFFQTGERIALPEEEPPRPGPTPVCPSRKLSRPHYARTPPLDVPNGEGCRRTVGQGRLRAGGASLMRSDGSRRHGEEGGRGSLWSSMEAGPAAASAERGRVAALVIDGCAGDGSPAGGGGKAGRRTSVRGDIVTAVAAVGTDVGRRQVMLCRRPPAVGPRLVPVVRAGFDNKELDTLHVWIVSVRSATKETVRGTKN